MIGHIVAITPDAPMIYVNPSAQALAGKLD